MRPNLSSGSRCVPDVSAVALMITHSAAICNLETKNRSSVSQKRQELKAETAKEVVVFSYGKGVVSSTCNESGAFECVSKGTTRASVAEG